MGTSLCCPPVTARATESRRDPQGPGEHAQVPGTGPALSQRTLMTQPARERLVARFMPRTIYSSLSKFNDEAGDLTKKGFLQTWMFGSSLLFKT